MNASQFPILSHGIYANHAAISPWPSVTSRAVTAFAAENAETGPDAYPRWIARERALREQLAGLTGARSIDDIALTMNTTEGLSTVAYGYPWRAGDKVVLPAGEFPTNRLPWIAQAARGVEIREVDIRGEDPPEDALIAALDSQTRVLAVSSVQFSDGLRIDLERLGAACADNGILFCVDAIQQLGALPVDVETCRIDCLAAGAHKWMLGPEGMGVFYCRQSAREKIVLTRQGWHMYDYPWNFERADWTPSGSARRFEPGSPNTLGQVALHASIQLILETGMEKVSSRILRNTTRLAAGLGSMAGVSVRSRTEPERQSGIVTFVVGARSDARALFKRLKDGGVTCALRDGGIRLSPHFYQDDAVIDRMLERIEDAL